MTQRELAKILPESITWEFPEYEKHERGRNWYIIAGVIAVGLIVYAILSANYFFALIILIVGFIIALWQYNEPLIINFSIEPDGVRLVDKFYSYHRFKDFSIVYKPEDKIKNLYFEYKNGFHPRLVIALHNTNPIIVRNYLLRCLPEDLERQDASFSEGFGKIFKI